MESGVGRTLFPPDGMMEGQLRVPLAAHPPNRGTDPDSARNVGGTDTTERQKEERRDA